MFTADLDNPDYLTDVQMVDLVDGSSRVCGMFGSLDDNIAPILEDVEFYQIELTTADTAEIMAGRSIANIFIEDNDGKYQVLVCFS